MKTTQPTPPDFWWAIESGKRNPEIEQLLLKIEDGHVPEVDAWNWNLHNRIRVYASTFKAEILEEVKKSPSTSIWTEYIENKMIELL